MLVKVDLYELRDGRSVPLAQYIVPPGTWLQDPTCGAIPVPNTATSDVRGIQLEHGRRVVVVCEPTNPPRIPPALLKLVTGPDSEWGRNGSAWVRRHCDRMGGTALDRAREYATKYVAGWLPVCPPVRPKDGPDRHPAPVALTTEQVAALLETEPSAVSVPQETVAVAAQPRATVTGQLTMFQWL